MCFIGSAQKGGVLIPSVMALRETAMTAPLDQQGEPLPSSVTAAPCHPPFTQGGFSGFFDKLMRLREIPEPHFFIDILLPFVLD